MKTQYKLTMIFLLFTFLITLLKFNGTIDDFAPYNIAIINEVIQIASPHRCRLSDSWLLFVWCYN